MSRAAVARLLLTLALCLPLLTAVTQAQGDPNLETGLKPYGSYHGGDLDSVSLTNGNVVIHAPLWSYPQRGKLRFGHFIGNNNKNWQVQTFSNVQGPYEKWTLGKGVMGAGVVSEQTVMVERTVTTTSDPNGTTIVINAYRMWTPDGSWHTLGFITPTTAATFDATGYRFQLTPGSDETQDTGIVTDREGVRYILGSFAAGAGSGSISSEGTLILTGPFNFEQGGGTTTTVMVEGATPLIVEDPNGNQWTVSNVMTDSLGRTITPSNPTASGCTSFTLPAPGGGTESASTCYTLLGLTTSFTQANVQQGSAAQLMLTSITLPNGTGWSFQYDSFGDLTKITLPTGGSISYTWANVNLACASSLTQQSRAVATRAVDANDTTGAHVWTYTWGNPAADGSRTNTVTDPDQNDTDHVVKPLVANTCQLFETETRYYQGTGSGRVLLKTVDTQYQVITGQDLVSEVVALPISYTTTWPDSTGNPGKSSVVQKSYDLGGAVSELLGDPAGASTPNKTFSFGDVLTESEYDYGQVPGTNPPTRTTVNNYLWQADSNYKSLNFLDLVSSTVVQDGAGNRAAESDYQYDQGTLAASGITTQHDSSPANGARRGNLTTTSHWLNPGGTSVSSTATYYDTGMVQSSTDPGGHTSTFVYSSAFQGAYVTHACNALNQCSDSNYDFNTGLVTSTTDPNNQTTSFAYDGMFRLTQENLPGGGQTTFAYSDTLPRPSVTITTKLDASRNLSSTAVVDGLGRLTQTQLTSDPEGTVKVDTTYDAAGHKATVSNPYRSTSDPTYGLTTYQYDGLGRVTKVIPPDGTASSNYVRTDYLENLVTVADQAGHARRSTSDALGRLIQVDEPGQTGVATAGSGNVSVSGTEQSFTSSGAGTSGTGSVTIGGSEQSSSQEFCNDFLPPTCTTTTIWDTGTVTITVNGFSKTVSYNQNSTASGLASALASAFNGDGTSPVTTSLSGSTVNLVSKATGTASNYTLSAASATDDPADFAAPSFTATPSGAALTGGSNGTPTTTYNTGTVTVTVNGYPATANYGQASTAGSVAQDLTTQLNAAASPVTATLVNSTITLTSRQAGALTNYTVATSASNNQPGTFAQPSFTATGPGALSSGSDGYGLQGPVSTYYSYDILGNLLRVDQKGTAPSDATQWRTRLFTYDSLGRLLTASNPESGTISYNYDADSNLTSKTAPAPNHTDGSTLTTSYCYDALHRLVSKAYAAVSCPMASPAASYSYDQGTNGIGRRTGMTDGSGSTAWTYDVMGRALSEQRTIQGVTKSTHYTYNLDGSMATLGYPSGRTITYGYSTAGRAVSAVDGGDSINYATAATYAPQGALAGVKYGVTGNFAGITTSNSYNQRLQPSLLSASAPAATVLSLFYDFRLGVADNGNVAAITNNRDSARSVSYSYDGLNRIATARTSQSALWGQSFGYDAWGNLLTQTVTQGTALPLSVSANGQNQIVGFCYDAAGNLLDQAACGSVHAYVYDAENRLSSTAGVTYAYDGDGKRVRKCPLDGSGICSAPGKLYWTGMGSDPLDESDASGNINEEYVFFNGKRIARADVGTGNTITAVHYYFADHLGSASVITSDSGAIEQESDYYPFGGERVITAGPNNYKFTGKERDSESGLDEFGARHYGGSLGRFVTPDPEQAAGFEYMEDPQSWNGYSYARNNPLLYTDPDGESYHVCDENGNYCSDQSDKEFDQNKKNAEGQGEVWKGGRIWLPNGNGGYDYKGSYVRTDIDIPGDPEANRNAAAMIGSGTDFVMAFMFRSVRDGVTGGVLGIAVGELAEGLAEGLNSAVPATEEVLSGTEEGSTYLYEKIGPNGEHLKYGVTNNPTARYTAKALAGGRLKILARGSRAQMLELERSLHSSLPIGPEERQAFYVRQQVSKGLTPPPYK